MSFPNQGQICNLITSNKVCGLDLHMLNVMK